MPAKPKMTMLYDAFCLNQEVGISKSTAWTGTSRWSLWLQHQNPRWLLHINSCRIHLFIKFVQPTHKTQTYFEVNKWKNKARYHRGDPSYKVTALKAQRCFWRLFRPQRDSHILLLCYYIVMMLQWHLYNLRPKETVGRRWGGFMLVVLSFKIIYSY